MTQVAKINGIAVTIPTHTGEVTGDINLSLDVTAISNKTLVTAATGDMVLIQDATDGLLKRVDVNDFLSGGGINNIVEDTTPQLGGQLDVNGFAIGDGTLELITFTETGSAVNQINIANAATGNGPTLSAAGDDANIDLNLSAKGTGNIAIGNFTFDGDQSVGSGQNNYVLTYDNGTGLISLEAATGGGATSLDELNDVTIGSPGPNEGDVLTYGGSPGVWTPQAPSAWTKVTFSYTQFSVSPAAAVDTIEAFTLPAGAILKGVVLKPTTAFTKGSPDFTAVTAEVGITGDLERYMEAFDIQQAVSDTTFSIAQNFDMQNWGSSTSVKVTIRTPGGTTDQFTAGAFEVYYLIETVKS
jgi:hypothetical protein